MEALVLSLVMFSLDKPDVPALVLNRLFPQKILSLFSVSKHGIMQTFQKKKRRRYDLIGLLCCLSSNEDSFLVLVHKLVAFVLGIKSVQGRCGSCSAWKECGGMRTVPHLSLKSALGEKATTAEVLLGLCVCSVVIILIFSWFVDDEGGEFAVQ